MKGFSAVGKCLAALFVAALLFGCASIGKLGQYEFRDHRIAALMNAPARAEVFADSPIFVDSRDLIGTALRAGAAVAKQIEARKVQERMEQALDQVEIPDRIEGQVLQDGAELLGCQAVDGVDLADFLIDLEIRRYGVDANSPFASVSFRIDVKMWLRDVRTGDTIWWTRLNATRPVSPSVFGLEEPGGEVVSMVVLSQLSDQAIAEGLTRLADDTANRLVSRLRQDYLEARFRR